MPEMLDTIMVQVWTVDRQEFILTILTCCNQTHSCQSPDCPENMSLDNECCFRFYKQKNGTNQASYYWQPSRLPNRNLCFLPKQFKDVLQNYIQVKNGEEWSFIATNAGQKCLSFHHSQLQDQDQQKHPEHQLFLDLMFPHIQ